MGTLYLVRHGQASFGADNYDELSALGRQQSERLGQYFKYKGITFDAALSGTLKRQIQTFAGICKGLDQGTDSRLEALPFAGLNEYNSEAVIAAIHPYPLEKPDTPEGYKHHFRLLRDGLAQWMAGVVSPTGMPSYRDFAAGVTSALDHIRSHHDGNVLLVSSGGPIATAVGHVLGTSPEATIDLNMRIRNSSVTEFSFTPKGHRLLSFNTLAHLDAPEYASWVTHS